METKETDHEDDVEEKKRRRMEKMMARMNKRNKNAIPTGSYARNLSPWEELVLILQSSLSNRTLRALDPSNYIHFIALLTLAYCGSNQNILLDSKVTNGLRFGKQDSAWIVNGISSIIPIFRPKVTTYNDQHSNNKSYKTTSNKPNPTLTKPIIDDINTDIKINYSSNTSINNMVLDIAVSVDNVHERIQQKCTYFLDSKFGWNVLDCLELSLGYYYSSWINSSNLLIIPQNYKDCTSISYIDPDPDISPADEECILNKVRNRADTEKIKVFLTDSGNLTTSLRFEYENYSRDMQGRQLTEYQDSGFKIRYFWIQNFNEAPFTQAFAISATSLYKVSIAREDDYYNKNGVLKQIGSMRKQGQGLSSAKVVGAYFDGKRLFVGQSAGRMYRYGPRLFEPNVTVFEVYSTDKNGFVLMEIDKKFEIFYQNCKRDIEIKHMAPKKDKKSKRNLKKDNININIYTKGGKKGKKNTNANTKSKTKSKIQEKGKEKKEKEKEKDKEKEQENEKEKQNEKEKKIEMETEMKQEKKKVEGKSKSKSKMKKPKKNKKYMLANNYTKMISWCFFVDDVNENKKVNDIDEKTDVDESKFSSKYLYLIMPNFTFKISFNVYLEYKEWLKLNKTKIKLPKDANISRHKFIWQKWVEYYNNKNDNTNITTTTNNNNNENIKDPMMTIARTSSFFERLGVDVDVDVNMDELDEVAWQNFEKSYGYDPRSVKCMFLYPQRALIAFVPRGKAGVALRTYQHWR